MPRQVADLGARRNVHRARRSDRGDPVPLDDDRLVRSGAGDRPVDDLDAGERDARAGDGHEFRGLGSEFGGGLCGQAGRGEKDRERDGGRNELSHGRLLCFAPFGGPKTYRVTAPP